MAHTFEKQDMDLHPCIQSYDRLVEYGTNSRLGLIAPSYCGSEPPRRPFSRKGSPSPAAMWQQGRSRQEMLYTSR